MKRAVLLFITGAIASVMSVAGQDLTVDEQPVLPDSVTGKVLLSEKTDMAPATGLSMGAAGVDDRQDISSGPVKQPDISYMGEKISSEIPRLPVFYSSPKISLNPLLYSNRNYYSGFDMVGVGSSFRLNERMTAGLNAYVSEMYMGPYCPRPYINATVSGDITMKLHDNFYLVGLGGYSVRKGFDPKRAPDIGASNYLGVGVNIKITESLGIGFSHTWHYYQGSWSGRTNYYPVGF